MSENKSLTEYRPELPEQFSEAQLAFLQAETPKAFIKYREGRGGGQFAYVEVGYVQLLLNTIFGSAGWDWEYSLVKELSFPNTSQIVVDGKLTVRIHDKQTGEVKATIVKTASGGGSIKFPKGDNTNPIDLADDMKSASADALKKAASYLGIAADVYAPKVFSVVKRLRNKQGRQTIGGGVVDEETEREIENTPEELQPDEREIRNQLLKNIFAAADRIHKKAFDLKWSTKTDEEKKIEIKTALQNNGIIINSFATAPIEDLKKAVQILNESEVI